MHNVYFTYSAGHTLLYVGVTRNVKTRLYAHKQTSAWFEHMVYSRVREFTDRSKAEAFEARAIAILKPLYNIRGINPDEVCTYMDLPDPVFEAVDEPRI